MPRQTKRSRLFIGSRSFWIAGGSFLGQTSTYGMSFPLSRRERAMDVSLRREFLANLVWNNSEMVNRGHGIDVLPRFNELMT